jgi:hypothetical protein
MKDLVQSVWEQNLRRVILLYTKFALYEVTKENERKENYKIRIS